MIEGIDVKIGWFANFVGGDGLAGFISAAALIGIAWSMRYIPKISLILTQHEKTTEENTDALIENAKAMKALRRMLDRAPTSRKEVDRGKDS